LPISTLRGEQLLRARTVGDHQQRQFNLGTGRHAVENAADFTLVSGQGAEVVLTRHFFLLLRRRRWGSRFRRFAAAGDQKTEQREQNQWS